MLMPPAEMSEVILEMTSFTFSCMTVMRQTLERGAQTSG